MATECVGFEPKGIGAKDNCTYCNNWNGKACKVRKLLDELYELYEESRGFNAIDRMMRGNRGVRFE